MEEENKKVEDISAKDLCKYASIPTVIVAGIIALACCLSNSTKDEKMFPMENMRDTVSNDTTLFLEQIQENVYNILEGEENDNHCGFCPSY